ERRQLARRAQQELVWVLGLELAWRLAMGQRAWRELLRCQTRPGYRRGFQGLAMKKSYRQECRRATDLHLRDRVRREGPNTITEREELKLQKYVKRYLETWLSAKIRDADKVTISRVS